MKNDSLSASSGFSLIELLMTIALTGIVGIVVLSSVKIGMRFVSTASARLDADYKLETFHAVLRRGLNLGSSLLALPTIRVTEGPRLSDAFGQGDLLDSGSADARPKQGLSGTLTFLELDAAHTFSTVRSGASGSAFVSLELCGTATQEELGSDAHYFLLAGIDGYVQVEGRLRRGGLRSDCPGGIAFKGELRLSAEAIFSSLPDHGDIKVNNNELQLSVLKNGLTLIPLLDAYAVYVDRRGRLRRRSLLTQESQPIAEGFEALRIRCQDETCSIRVLLPKKSAASYQEDFSLDLRRPGTYAYLDLLR